MSRASHLLFVPIAVLSLAGCAIRNPVIYSRPDVAGDRHAAVAEDVAECKQVGEAYAVPGPGVDVARDTATGGILGAAAGAVGGAIWGSAAHGAAAGAAGGAATGLLSNLLFKWREPQPVYQAAVNQCLADRGYRVIGWQ